MAIRKNASAYPWGPINSNPWYYADPVVYQYVMLVECVLLIGVLVPAVFFICKGKRRKAGYWFLGFWVLMVLLIVNGWFR